MVVKEHVFMLNYSAWIDLHCAHNSGGFARAAKDDGIRDVFETFHSLFLSLFVNDMIPGDADLITWEKEREVSI